MNAYIIKFSNKRKPISNGYMTDTRTILSDENVTAQADFQDLSNRIAQHTASHHQLFAFMANIIRAKSLTTAQADMFSRCMLARLGTTMPNIAYVLKAVIRDRKFAYARTALQNLTDEMGGTETHAEMAERAFNAFRKAYALPPITIADILKMPILPDVYVQQIVWRDAYKTFPVMASWAQERASGGYSPQKLGMMGDLFQIFSACYEQSILDGPTFQEEIFPYFRAHCTIEEKNGTYHIIFDPKATEFLHAQRAEQDAAYEFMTTPKESRTVLVVKVMAFLDAQARLFDAIQHYMNVTSTSHTTANSGLKNTAFGMVKCRRVG